MIKKNQIFFYILYFCLIALIAISYNIASRYLQLYTAIYFSSSIPLFLTKEFLLMLFGVSFGLDYILKEIKKEGQWSIKIPRLVILALPCFVIFLIRLVVASPIPLALPKFLLPYSYFIYLTPVLFQIFFGYILITSFFKKTDVKQNNLNQKGKP